MTEQAFGFGLLLLGALGFLATVVIIVYPRRKRPS